MNVAAFDAAAGQPHGEPVVVVIAPVHLALEPHNQWLGGIQHGNGVFAAVGGYGYSAWSADGVTWTGGASRATEAARSLAFGDGMFVGATDPGTWWTSTDGRAWARGTGGHSSRVVYCQGAFKDAALCAAPEGRNQGRAAFAEGVHVAVRGNVIERSTDGVTWRPCRWAGRRSRPSPSAAPPDGQRRRRRAVPRTTHSTMIPASAPGPRAGPPSVQSHPPLSSSMGGNAAT